MSETFDPISYINEPNWHSSRLGLDRITELMERLGNPQDNLRVIHVAGTNGKGSTCAFVASILKTAGFRTGLFSSPYIIEFNDRIRVNGTNIDNDALREVALLVRDQAEAMDDHPTEFELMTAVALLHFARERCEFAVLEVGLGGRLDSTNVVEHPEVCAIAPISFDHMALLGSTLPEIAGEKAGIIKKGAAVVSAPQEPEVQKVIKAACAEADCVLAQVDTAQLAGASADFSYRIYQHLRIRLMGSYQPQNAALAIEIIEQLRARGVSVSDDALREGLAETTWPGRFEVVAHHPEFIVDGGHNVQGMQALVDSLALNYPGRKITFLLSVLEDKDYPRMLEIVMPVGTSFVCTTASSPRALSSYKLARAIRWTCQDMMGCTASHNAYEERTIPGAVRKARELAGEDGVVCACGSLYSIADIMSALKDQGAL